MKFSFVLILNFFALFLWSCSPSYEEIQRRSDDWGSQSLETKPSENDFSNASYGEVKEKIFDKKCTICHGLTHKINLIDYPSVYKFRRQIKSSVFLKKTMPSGNVPPLEQEELRLLRAWLEKGAPDGPIKPAISIEPNFDSISKNIFDLKCNMCHNDPKNKRAFKNNLKSEENILAVPDMISIYDPENSALLDAVKIKNPKFLNKRMPPIKEGFEALSEYEIDVLQQWIFTLATKIQAEGEP